MPPLVFSEIPLFLNKENEMCSLYNRNKDKGKINRLRMIDVKHRFTNQKKYAFSKLFLMH